MLPPLLPEKGIHRSPRTCRLSLIRQHQVSPLSFSSSYLSLAFWASEGRESGDQSKRSFKESLKNHTKKATHIQTKPRKPTTIWVIIIKKNIPKQTKQQQKSLLLHCHCFLLCHVCSFCVYVCFFLCTGRGWGSSSTLTYKQLKASPKQPASPFFQECHSNNSHWLCLETEWNQLWTLLVHTDQLKLSSWWVLQSRKCTFAISATMTSD